MYEKKRAKERFIYFRITGNVAVELGNWRHFRIPRKTDITRASEKDYGWGQGAVVKEKKNQGNEKG